MFFAEDDLTLHITRGDTGELVVRAVDDTHNDAEVPYIFQAGDVLRLKVFEKKNCENVVLQKDFGVEVETETVSLELTENDTRIGNIINKPVDYWYEIELNPFTEPQTIVGYDDYGAKVFKLYPEGKDTEVVPPTEEEVGAVDSELSLTSEKAIQNQAVAKAIVNLSARVRKDETEVEVLKSRFNNFTALNDGSTTGDAELTDIRVGNNGTIYETAGDAVRGQISDIDQEVNKRYVLNIGKLSDNIDTSFGSNRVYYEFVAKEDFSINSLNIPLYGDVSFIKATEEEQLLPAGGKFEFDISINKYNKDIAEFTSLYNGKMYYSNPVKQGLNKLELSSNLGGGIRIDKGSIYSVRIDGITFVTNPDTEPATATINRIYNSSSGGIYEDDFISFSETLDNINRDELDSVCLINNPTATFNISTSVLDIARSVREDADNGLFNGQDGVGIQSIRLKETNVYENRTVKTYTITMTDGSTFDFDVTDGIGYDNSGTSTLIQQTVTSRGTDLAEVGMWNDLNPNNENRLYRFVTIVGENKEIEIANSSSQIFGTSNRKENVGFLSGYTKGAENNKSLVIVSIIGVVPVMTNDNTIVVGDRVMSDDNGYAVKSTNNLGYRVLRVNGKMLTIVISPNTDMIQRIKTDVQSNEYNITALKNSVDIIERKNTDILAFHPDYTEIPKLKNLRYKISNNGNHSQLVLLHFSDIHGDGVNLQRVLDYYNHYGSYIDDILHTGDSVENTQENGVAFWDNVQGSEKILNVAGNHDAWNSEYALTDKQSVYNLIFNEKINNWNVVQPATASTDYDLYYYKDYVSQKIRLIVLDCMFYDENQNSWLEETLNDARTQDLAVIIASHYPVQLKRFGGMTFNSELNSCATNGVECVPKSAQDLVKDFKNNGGEFVMWMCGHTHMLYSGTSVNYPDQVVYVSDGNSMRKTVYDSYRKVGTKSQDSFSLISVDRGSKCVRILKVGNNVDKFLKPIETMAFNYETAKPLWQCENEVEEVSTEVFKSLDLSEHSTKENVLYLKDIEAGNYVVTGKGYIANSMKALLSIGAGVVLIIGDSSSVTKTATIITSSLVANFNDTSSKIERYATQTYVQDAVLQLEEKMQSIYTKSNIINASSTDDTLPTSKAVYDFVQAQIQNSITDVLGGAS